MRSVHL